MKKSVLFVLFAVLMIIPFIIEAQDNGGDVVMPNELGNVVFSHDNHAAKGLICEQCHPELYPKTVKDRKIVTMEEMESGLSCGKCHNGKPAFSVKGDCFTCHAKKE